MEISQKLFQVQIPHLLCRRFLSPYSLSSIWLPALLTFWPTYGPSSSPRPCSSPPSSTSAGRRRRRISRRRAFGLRCWPKPTGRSTIRGIKSRIGKEHDCVLKVDVSCEACKMKLYGVLRSVSGPYSVTIDAEEGTAKISGEVDPNMLLQAIGSGGRHAELKWIDLKSPAPKRAYYDDGYSSYSYGYGHSHCHCHCHDYRAIKQPYWGRRRVLPEYSCSNGSYSHYPYM